MIKRLQQELSNVQAEKADLLAELAQLRHIERTQPAAPEGAVELSDEAIRKRLDRMCAYNAKGTLVCTLGVCMTAIEKISLPSKLRNLKVPQDVYNAWHSSNAQRAELTKLFKESGFDKEPYKGYMTCFSKTAGICRRLL